MGGGQIEGDKGGAAGDVFAPFDPFVFGDFAIAVTDVIGDGGEDVIGAGVFVAVDFAVIVLVLAGELAGEGNCAVVAVAEGEDGVAVADGGGAEALGVDGEVGWGAPAELAGGGVGEEAEFLEEDVDVGAIGVWGSARSQRSLAVARLKAWV